MLLAATADPALSTDEPTASVVDESSDDVASRPEFFDISLRTAIFDAFVPVTRSFSPR
jgi:hypothetical protein